MTSHSSKTTTDHDEIRRWAEARKATPACVKGTGSKNDPGMIRLDFPGYSGDSLEPISWDQWFKAFDDNNLALVYQDETADGAKSNFNKLIGRETADKREHGDSHASRHHDAQSSSRTGSHTSGLHTSGSHTSSHSSGSHESGSHSTSHHAGRGSSHDAAHDAAHDSTRDASRRGASGSTQSGPHGRSHSSSHRGRR